jgi:hypothetical protein
VAEIGDVGGGLDLEFHAFGDDEKLAFAIALPFAAGEPGLERAGHDVHVFNAIRAEAVLAGFDHADGGGAIGGADGETLDFAFKIGIVFHARDLMPFFTVTINSNRTRRRRLSLHSNRGHVAPLAHLLVVQPVDGLVFPDRA